MKYIKISALILAIFVVLGTVFFMVKKSVYAPADLSTLPLASYSGGASVNDIRVISVVPGGDIVSPLRITGEARGPWYFEASFPVLLTDGDGLIIAEGYGQAQGEWMTTEFVPFVATLEFTIPANADAFGRRGTLIFKNDNPSGDPARDMAVEIPVLFK
ncbi:MAG: hypothetical protein KBC33_00175 [Candidatus Pacebacteria bacterium]|nr:hypothetical protein [Candidatus Paceibacterota bacterium]